MQELSSIANIDLPQLFDHLRLDEGRQTVECSVVSFSAINALLRDGMNSVQILR